MRLILILIIVFPCFASAQASKENFIIYSKYLKEFTIKKKVEKIYFVVNETTDFTKMNYLGDLNTSLEELRLYVKNKKSLSDIYSEFRFFAITIKKDTIWMQLLDELAKKMNEGFVIENNFSADLNTIIINKRTFNKYFKHSKSNKRIEKNWIRFHNTYKMPSALIEFSDIAKDEKHAVFYFSNRCGGLCGDGNLIFFINENGEWKLLKEIPLWYN